MADNPKNQANLLQVLSNKSFFGLWLSQAISQIVMNMLTLVLAVLIYEATRSNTQVSLLYLTISLPAAVFGILSGVFVDKYNKRNVLIYSILVRILLVVLIAIFRTNLLTVFICTILISVASQFFVPAEAALIPKLISKDLLLSANSLFTLTFYSAIIGGFVGGGPLLRIFGGEILLWIMGGLLLLSLIILFMLPLKVDDYIPTGRNLSLLQIKNDILDTLRYIKNVIPVQQAILLMTMAQAIISIFLTLGPGFADRILHIKVADASLVILGPAAVGMIIGAFFIGSLSNHIRKRKLIHFGILLSGIILMILSVIVRNKHYESIADILQAFFSMSWETGVFVATIICFFILGIANSMIDISCNTVLQENADDANRGKIYGVLQSLISGVAFLPVLISGILADFLGIEKIIVVLGILLTGFGIFANKITSFLYSKKNP